MLIDWRVLGPGSVLGFSLASISPVAHTAAAVVQCWAQIVAMGWQHNSCCMMFFVLPSAEFPASCDKDMLVHGTR